MATTGTLAKPATLMAGAAVRSPNRVAQLAAVSIAEQEARAKVLASVPVVERAVETVAAPEAVSSQEAQDDALAMSLDDIDLSDAPALRPMKTMRVHQRSTVLADCLELGRRLDGREVDASGNMASLDPEMFKLFGEIDLFMEKQVVDVDAYVAWSTELEGMDAMLRVIALFGKFTERLGG